MTNMTSTTTTTKAAPVGVLRVGTVSINLALVSHVAFAGKGAVTVNFIGGGPVSFPYVVENLDELLTTFNFPSLGELKEAPPHPFNTDAGV